MALPIADGVLLDSAPVALPAPTLSMSKRSMTAEDFERFAATRLYELSYMSCGLRIKAYLALPPADEAKMPAVLFNAGGTGERGALNPAAAAATVGLYASWGYVALASQYRGRGGSEGREEWGAGDVDDAMNALALLRSFEYADAERVGIIGGSRGGMMALQMLCRTQDLRAAVTFGAPALFTDLEDDAYILDTARRFLPPEALADGARLRAELEKRSAALWAEKLCKTTPLLAQHGSGDRRVDADHAYRLGQALQRAQHPYKLIVYDNADHVLAGRREESNRDAREWIDRYVKRKEALPKVGPHGA